MAAVEVAPSLAGSVVALDKRGDHSHRRHQCARWGYRTLTDAVVTPLSMSAPCPVCYCVGEGHPRGEEWVNPWERSGLVGATRDG